MDAKTVAVVGLVGAVALMTAGPPAECERQERQAAFCQIKAPDLTHAEGRIPAAEQTTERVITSSSPPPPQQHHLVAADLASASPTIGAPPLA
jgi:hypothetical protein